MNTVSEALNDVYCLNVDKAPFSWVKLETPGNLPPKRVYHSAALCSMGSATGMMVIFGGRTGGQSAVNDTWGLRRHRDGRWDWINAPYKNNDQPLARYQHSTLFIGTMMIVLGGRTNTVGETVHMEIYETETSEWKKFNSV
jgi:protein phosphatase